MEKNIYFEVDAINSSLLKKVKNPKNLLEEVQETDEMIIGSAVDCILTRNGDFDKEFMYSGDYRISLAVKNIIDKVFELSKNKTTLFIFYYLRYIFEILFGRRFMVSLMGPRSGG